MHPKDKVDPSLKKDIVYQWLCTKPNCKSSYIGETSRSLCERVKEHSKEGSKSAIYQHCATKDHPPPNIDQFKVIDQEKSQIAHQAKEAIHIRKLDPELNRNVGKMVIPRVFDSLLGIKPKNPCVASLLSQEVGSQDIGINLTQFHSYICHATTRPPRPSSTAECLHLIARLREEQASTASWEPRPPFEAAEMD